LKENIVFKWGGQVCVAPSILRIEQNHIVVFHDLKQELNWFILLVVMHAIRNQANSKTAKLNGISVF
jgi:hypothetical protein